MRSISKTYIGVFLFASIVWLSGDTYAVDSELTLDTSDSGSGFTVKDSLGTTVMRAGGDGNVGIGTTSPQDPLHLNGSGPFIRFTDTDGTKSASIGMHQNFLKFDEAGVSTKMAIDLDSGNVGIGTNNPQGKLDVNGAIYQRGGSLHADYVFESNYKLESILEHADFMWKNKHLAAIPDFKVDHNGQEVVEVGAHRKGIVEELEKAHIYIEQLYKQNKKLVEQNKALEVRLARIEAGLSE